MLPAFIRAVSRLAVSLDVFDMSGRLMEHAVLEGGGPGECPPRAGGLPAGVSLVRACTGGPATVGSFVVLEQGSRAGGTPLRDASEPAGERQRDDGVDRDPVELPLQE
jgi:hypothetical protein